MDDSKADLVAQERAATIAFALADGAKMTTRDVAHKTGLQLNGAWRMMNKLMRVLPITLDEEGRWYRVEGLQRRVREYPAR